MASILRPALTGYWAASETRRTDESGGSEGLAEPLSAQTASASTHFAVSKRIGPSLGWLWRKTGGKPRRNRKVRLFRFYSLPRNEGLREICRSLSGAGLTSSRITPRPNVWAKMGVAGLEFREVLSPAPRDRRQLFDNFVAEENFIHKTHVQHVDDPAQV
jgi:hypothetical protein